MKIWSLSSAVPLLLCTALSATLPAQAQQFEVKLNCPVERSKSVTVPHIYKEVVAYSGEGCICSSDPGIVQLELTTALEDTIAETRGVLDAKRVTSDVLRRIGLGDRSVLLVPKKQGASKKEVLYCLERSQIAAYIESVFNP